MNLAYKQARLFSNNHKVNDFEELKSAAVFGLVKASREFDDSKGKFSPFAWRRIGWEILNNFKFQMSVTKVPYMNCKTNGKLRDKFDYRVSLDKIAHKLVLGDRWMDKIDAKIDAEKVFKAGNSILTPKQLKTLNRLYENEFEDKVEIAREQGVSKASLYGMEKRIKERIQNALEDQRKD